MKPYTPWVFRVQPYPGESFGHFLSRFRRANQLSSKGLARVLGLTEKTVAFWEVPSRSRPPNYQQLSHLAPLVGLDIEHLAAMLPPPRSQMYLATRLCAVCYREAPAHKVAWQLVANPNCDRHQLSLLSACPICGACFELPALWEKGCCRECGKPFAQMVTYQRSSP